MLSKNTHRRAQVTLFVILAILVVVLGISLYFIFSKTTVLTKTNEVESYFQTCVDDKVKEAVATAELQGGYLELPEFSRGSESFPFSNYFKFISLDIPYWAYSSGNGVYKTQKPELDDIEKQFSDFLKIYVQDCLEFNQFPEEVNYSTITDISVKINSGDIETKIIMPLTVDDGEKIYRASEHTIRTKTEFGSLYKTAETFFDENNRKNILANYTLDVIYNYAPVDGLEISCVPKVLSKLQIQDDVKKALQENIQELKVKGSNFYLSTPQNKYFVISLDQPVTKQFNFLYQEKWPTTMEVWPNEGDTIKMEPVGKDSGLGMIGFCFIPYHFVYDLSYPVLIQISSGTEMFQFPVLVVLDKMAPVNSNITETINSSFDLCSVPGQLGTVFTSYDSKPVESSIYFRCLGQRCPIGKTVKDGDFSKLTTLFPRCVNGVVISEAEGYKTSESLVSTNEEFVLSVSLSKLYEIPIQVNTEANEKAIITFRSDDSSYTVIYPDEKSINLSEGYYNVSVQIYKDATIAIGQQQIEKCISIPSPGIPGMLGLKDQQCYNMTLPASQFTSVPTGGGTARLYAAESDLKDTEKLSLQAEKFSTPTSLDSLMDIYDSINLETLQINFIK